MNALARHVHLDPVGGIAGDMFVAAILDAFDDLAEPCLAAVRDLVQDLAQIELSHGRYSGFSGARFNVRIERSVDAHSSWRDIRVRLQAGLSDDAGRAEAIGIFQKLAEAEAEVHGVDPDAVHFHEVGALDSIVDIAAAGYLIHALDSATWSVGELPLGGGTVETQHGVMPVPAPATARLLAGFPLVDDGIAGERVTPTGAAILAYLRPGIQPRIPAGTLAGTGMGFGTRTLPGRPNALRVLVFQDASQADISDYSRDQVGVIRFEIDDQTGEDLAVALDHLRGSANVLDALQVPAFGKKGRMVVSVQLLVRPDSIDEVVAMVFTQTTTLGVRTGLETRHVVSRRQMTDAAGIDVKIAERAGRQTAKADMSAIAERGGDHAGRMELRRTAEADALAAGKDNDDG